MPTKSCCGLSELNCIDNDPDSRYCLDDRQIVDLTEGETAEDVTASNRDLRFNEGDYLRDENLRTLLKL